MMLAVLKLEVQINTSEVFSQKPFHLNATARFFYLFLFDNLNACVSKLKAYQ